ncbi:MAG: polysaccharide biosynthesis protein [Puniceicoccales bacterium]|jgi:FlaA1/EpsC-like NDP-sugar epimerase|nr:polysaccharide biosynthesis protein [Puniceicoccales bacterium]
MRLFRKIFGHFSIQRITGLVVVYAVLLSGALFAAYGLRYLGLDNWEKWKDNFSTTVLWFVPAQVLALAVVRHFSGMLSYFRIPELARLLQALLAVFLFALVIELVVFPDAERKLPLGVLIADGPFALLAVCALRVFFRMLHDYIGGRAEALARGGEGKLRRVAILGAGDVGAALAANWLARPALRRVPVVFYDDNVEKHGLRLHNIPVAGGIAQLVSARRKHGVDEVAIALGAAPVKRLQEVIRLARQLGFPAEIVPSLMDMASGRARASRIRPVDIQDLLGREPVALDSEGINRLVRGRTVLVTGAGGSIGGELCRQIAARAPGRLLLVERCEAQMFQIEQNLLELGHGGTIQPLVGDICDLPRMRHIFALHRPDVVFHAAAHKHVFLMERQPAEAFRNNTLGTARLAELAIEFGVEKFVLVSTDKAINPTSVMGATKRMAEIWLQARQAKLDEEEDAAAAGGAAKPSEHRKTRLLAVRFGNVLGSSGSVIPIFRKQIAEGGPVRVTHPDVTRYFMTIPEAVGLVLQCAVLGTGGEIFVLNMGKPVRILDLARQMIELSGFTPDADIAIEFIGLRPGEKLFEELQYLDERHVATEHSEVMRFVGEPRSLDEVERAFDAISANITEKPGNALKLEFQHVVPEYHPHLAE